jgi:pilus assembly protein TadC
MIAATLLLATALLLSAGPRSVRDRVAPLSPRRGRRGEKPSAPDPFATASAFDVLAVCLSAGLSVPEAATATASFATPALRAVLQRAADLLRLGADPDVAWQSPDEKSGDGGEALTRLARRSASSGSALAAGVAQLAEQERQDVTHSAAAAAERAGVLIAGPLGLCFLPAFVCLGVVPVVAGLAADIFGAGLL